MFLLLTAFVLRCTHALDAAFQWNGKTYFFKGDRCICFDTGKDRADPGYPRYIDEVFPGMWNSSLDAAISWENGKAYFFKGNQYLRFDLNKWRADPGYPAKISSDSWKGVWQDGMDAAVDWNNGCVYFFKGKQYLRYNWKVDSVDAGYPMDIGRGWAGLHPDIDAALLWPNGKSYFFYGNQYIRYDDASSHADAGYPLPIDKNTWPGVAFPALMHKNDGTYRYYSTGAKKPAIPADYDFPLTKQFQNGCFAFGISHIAAYKYGMKMDLQAAEQKVGKKRSELWSSSQITAFLDLFALACTWYTDADTFFDALSRAEPVLIQYKKWTSYDYWVGHFVAVYSFDSAGIWISESVSVQHLNLPYSCVFDETGKNTQFSFAIVSRK